MTARVRNRAWTGVSASVRTTVLAPLVAAAATPAPVQDTAEATREEVDQTVDDRVGDAQRTVANLQNGIANVVRNLPVVCGYARPACDRL